MSSLKAQLARLDWVDALINLEDKEAEKEIAQILLDAMDAWNQTDVGISAYSAYNSFIKAVERHSIHWHLDLLVCEIDKERARAVEKHGSQIHLPDSTDNPTARETWETIARNSCDRAFREGRLTHSHILDEECAEALTAAAQGDVKSLRKELVQVSAVCAQWIEALDVREAKELAGEPAPSKTEQGEADFRAAQLVSLGRSSF